MEPGQRKLRRSSSQPSDAAPPAAAALPPLGSPPLTAPIHHPRTTTPSRADTPPALRRSRSMRPEAGERGDAGADPVQVRDLQDFMREEAALLRQRYEEQRRTAEMQTERLSEAQAERRISISLLASDVGSEGRAPQTPHDVQTHLWSLLFSIAHRTDSAARFPHFLLLLELLGRLLPDARAARLLDEEMRRAATLEAFHRVTNKRELVLWLHALHDRFNERCEAPFYAVALLADAEPHARYLLSRRRFQLTEPPPRGPEAADAPLLQLPDELLLAVLARLPAAALLRCLRVCRRFNRLADDAVLWRGLFVREFEASGEELMRINAAQWKRNLFAWRTWEALSELFDGDEADATDALVVEKEEEEWVTEEREVELLVAEDVGRVDPDAAHVSRKRVVKARRRKRLSIALALQWPTGAAAVAPGAAAAVEWTAAQQEAYLRLIGLHPLPDLSALLPPLALRPRAAKARAEDEARPRRISQIRRLRAAVSGSRIRHATLPKLVEHLTSPFSHDLDYMKTFLLTYPLFATPDVLLALLLRRYFVVQPPEFAADDWQKLVQRPIQLRVINIVKSWIENYYADFDEYMLASLTRFASNVLTDKLSRQILAILARQKSLSAAPALHTKDYQFSELPPYPDVPKHIFSARLSIWDISDLEIARQLTLIEFALFSAITPREMLRYAQKRSQRGGSEAVGVLAVVEAPHVAAMLARFRGTAKWVGGVLAAAARGKERARYLRRFVGIAGELLRLSNFSTLMAILTGLERQRGSEAWEELPTRAKRDLAQMEALLVEPELYVSTLQSRAPAIIPYLEAHLRKLQQILELVPGTRGRLVHWAKHKYLYSVAAQVADYQQTPYNLQPVAQIAALLAWKEDEPRDDAAAADLRGGV